MSAKTLRLVTYNLQKCVGMDLRRRPDRSLMVLEQAEADVAILQEADKRLPPRPAALPHDLIEAEGWKIVHFGEPGGSLGWHGNAMLVRNGVKVEDTSHVELPGLEPRGAIRADLKTPIGRVRLVGLHLGLVRRYRLLQMHAIIRALEKLPDIPTVLAGDFNHWGPLRDLDTVAGEFSFLDTEPSFPAPRPAAALDRFALTDNLTARAHGVLEAFPARVASDHLPVWAEIARSK